MNKKTTIDFVEDDSTIESFDYDIILFVINDLISDYHDSNNILDLCVINECYDHVNVGNTSYQDIIKILYKHAKSICSQKWIQEAIHIYQYGFHYLASREEDYLYTFNLQLAHFLEKSAREFEEDFKIKQAEYLYRQAFKIRIRNRKIGFNNANCYDSLRALAWNLIDQGMYNKTEYIIQQILNTDEQFFEDSFLENHLANLFLLAYVFLRQRKFIESEKTFVLLLKIRETNELKYTKEHKVVLLNYTRLCIHTGNYEKAKSLLKQAFKCIHLNPIKNSYDSYFLFLLLAELYTNQGKFLKAFSYFRKIFKTVCKEIDKSCFCNILEHFAHFFEIQGKFKKANALYKRSMTLLSELFEYCHYSQGTNMTKYASLLVVWGKTDLAQYYYQKALDIFKECHTEDHWYAKEAAVKLKTLKEKTCIS